MKEDRWASICHTKPVDPKSPSFQFVHVFCVCFIWFWDTILLCCSGYPQIPGQSPCLGIPGCWNHHPRSRDNLPATSIQRLKFQSWKPCWSFLPCRLHRGTLCLTLHWVATGEFYEMQPLWEGGGTPLTICFQGSATSFPFIYKVCGSTHFTDRDESPKLCLSGKVKWGQVIIFKGNKNDKGRQSWVG